MTRSLFFIVLLFALPSFADVIFIDLNNASQEVAAAQRGRPGETIWKIPSTSSANMAKQDEAQKEVDKWAEKIQKSCADGASDSSCSDYRTNLEKATNNLDNTIGKNRLTPERLKSELAQLKAKGVDINSVVISGHDGSGRFSGSNGKMEAAQIDAAFEDFPSLTKNVRSVLLWGCYTTSLGSIDGHWKRVFPNVAVFAGFDGRAPSKLRDWNYDYMEDFLRLDKDLIATNDRNVAAKIIGQMRGFKVGASAICAHNCIYTPAGKLGVKCDDIGEIRQRCSMTNEQDVAAQKAWECYRDAATPECANPPRDTGDNNVLRKYFEFVDKRQQACDDYWKELGKSDSTIPRSDRVQNLLFYNNEKLNLGTMHRADLQYIDGVLKDVGAPSDLTVSDLPRMSRAQIKARIGALQAFVDRPDKKGMNHPQSVKLDYLRGNIAELSGLLVGMNRNPPDWIDPTSNRDMALTDLASPKRFKEIETDHEYYKIQVNTQSTQRSLAGRSSLSGQLTQVQAKYSRALVDYQQEGISDQEKMRRQKSMLDAAKETSDLQKQINREVAPELINRVLQEKSAKQQAGELSPAQSQAYDRYLSILRAQ